MREFKRWQWPVGTILTPRSIVHGLGQRVEQIICWPTSKFQSDVQWCWESRARILCVCLYLSPYLCHLIMSTHPHADPPPPAPSRVQQTSLRTHSLQNLVLDSGASMRKRWLLPLCVYNVLNANQSGKNTNCHIWRARWSFQDTFASNNLVKMKRDGLSILQTGNSTQKG